MKKIILALILVLIISLIVVNTTNKKVGSVNVGGEYRSKVLDQYSSTHSNSYYYFKKSSGTLGSIILNATGSGYSIFYDATTTDATLRNNVATSSLDVLAVIVNNQPAGVYVYDITFKNGLLGVLSSTLATTTITWR